MTRREITKPIAALEAEYGWANTWPISYQEEYERLCGLLYPENNSQGVKGTGWSGLSPSPPPNRSDNRDERN